MTSRARSSRTTYILLAYGMVGVLPVGDAEAGEEEYMANGPYAGPLIVIKV